MPIGQYSDQVILKPTIAVKTVIVTFYDVRQYVG